MSKEFFFYQYKNILFLLLAYMVVQSLTYYTYKMKSTYISILNVLKMKTTEFANRVDPDEVAQNEPSHLHLLCLPSGL